MWTSAESLPTLDAASLDESAVKRLLSEQRRYYSARAPEYDDWRFRRARYTLDAEAAEAWFTDVAELEAELERFAPRGDVLELAAPRDSERAFRLRLRPVPCLNGSETQPSLSRICSAVEERTLGWASVRK
jgi:hypothetical protein